jgi:hypothetical protein
MIMKAVSTFICLKLVTLKAVTTAAFTGHAFPGKRRRSGKHLKAISVITVARGAPKPIIPVLPLLRKILPSITTHEFH